VNVKNSSSGDVQNLKVTFTSNLADTIISNIQIAVLAPDSVREVELTVNFAPLRWWNLEVQALDSMQNVLAQGNAGPISSTNRSFGDAFLVTLVRVFDSENR
jgi:hypothetical protein